MLKKIVFSLALSLPILAVPFSSVQLVQADGEYRDVHEVQLDNGISAIFIDANSEMVLVMFCISCGSTDEVDKEGIANVLSKIYAKKLNENAENLHYGAEVNSNTSYDQSVYYVLGKKENLDAILQNFAQIYAGFPISDKDVEDQKQSVQQSLVSRNQIDKDRFHSEIRRSLYWHSKYGCDIEGTFDSLRQISKEDIQRFKDRHYTDNRVTVIISGGVNRKEVIEMLKKHFKTAERPKTESKIERMKEPPHHGSTVTITKYSDQVSVPMVEMYWKIPSYHKDKDEALAVEIFINALNDILQRELIEEQRLVASVSFSYSSWNYEYGDLCIAFTPRDSEKITRIAAAVLAEIKTIAADGLTAEQAKAAAAKIAEAGRFVGGDMFDVADKISKRLASGCGFDFVLGYPKFAQKYDLEKVNRVGKELFLNVDPCVTAVIRPKLKMRHKDNNSGSKSEAPTAFEKELREASDAVIKGVSGIVNAL